MGRPVDHPVGEGDGVEATHRREPSPVYLQSSAGGVSLTASAGPTAYGGYVDRSLRLAALASAAVPGLDPMAVQEVVSGDDEHFDVAFIQDTQQRRWVIRAPRDEVSAARMDASLALLALLHRRVPFAVPAAKGFAPIAGIGRAAVNTLSLIHI